jgi:hypothetical protein
MNGKTNKRLKEILHIKYVENGKTITDFSMEFRKWRRHHRTGGGSPYIIETSGRDMFHMNRIEITLRSEEADTIEEERKNRKEVKI